ncbi:hypothetical protein [Thermoanaerobacter thermocopriae]|uniref:hypothetical protein n=1 Tax=Thermoanaerobacter thermocopriae TaxID=29350 RepID=UPI000B1E369C|nr:hypothetical protein [Thermoanaerobacter thermocopriae]
MKKFEFTLQPILNLKEQSEKIEKEKLAKVMAEINVQKEELRKLTNHLNEILEKTKGEMKKELLYTKLLNQVCM